jgi:hypothetical protein
MTVSEAVLEMCAHSLACASQASIRQRYVPEGSWTFFQVK